MKNSNTIQSRAILAVALVAAFLSAGSAFHAKEMNPQTSVTVVAKRMSEAEKQAFDNAETAAIQTVVVVAKRLPSEGKVAAGTTAKKHKAA